MYAELLDNLIILNYKSGGCLKYTYEKNEKGVKEGLATINLDSESIKKILSEICCYIIQ